MAIGSLQVRVLRGNVEAPVDNAKIVVSQHTSEGTRQTEQQLITDSSGLSGIVELDAPEKEFSQTPSNTRPYSTCDIRVSAEGYEDFEIKGTQILPDTLSLQDVRLRSTNQRRQNEEQTDEDIIVIPEAVLFGDYPVKIPEDPVKPLPSPTGGVVLQKPVVPQYIVVHLGAPNDTSVPNVTVNFADYIKNVCSSEIYATWPETAIRANIYCITSFALNRIYTEWYRNQGKNFQVTNHTAYDQAFFYGRNIYANISRLVDELFTTYVQRQGQKQPLLTQYVDGVRVVRDGWFSQWGSKYLADSGKFPYEILTHYYGTDINLVRAEKVVGIPQSFPGYALRIGSSGQPVRTVQTFLNRIAVNFPAIPKLAVTGVYDAKTATSVKKFQEVFKLSQSGIVDYATWFAISRLYVAVTKIAELREEDLRASLNGLFVPPIVGDYDGYLPVIDYPTN
ncbi:peptidoglycan-binding protein [Clostridium cellulovorans]|uniref:Peptidoglycan-binding domain 1 protein n=1 Tax=Clostridium cellulovorans (strain ATCC 35296 / DSM 3052 / OCM 3 / 743B) TaxID=573061 RepID=D9SN51_CLOC7|nr:peptidoglycan-binding protein [Clostridium cellulovorans]ADL51917.1 Peptidoglycan-binding domain 1 protein [Clostridium cellulovorans 743B]